MQDCNAAGLPKICVKEPEACKWDAPCPNSIPNDLKENFASGKCTFVPFVSGGKTTLEQCVKSPFNKSDFLKLMKDATKTAKCFYVKKLLHNDFQLKNLMAQKCKVNGVRVVDLDTVALITDDDDIINQFNKEALSGRKDLKKLLGTSRSDADSIAEWKGLDSDAKYAAKQLEKKKCAESTKDCEDVLLALIDSLDRA